ncbi:DUF6603 domain-containing protein [Paenibacillus alginolyticus]|uniref:DUF6603 domain-containing protein n=2 Tax=Paenibacillus alginolyticus TaxID=59839 RepID=A0ABT4GDS9_9BACL|nr:DUF6603 domain-containing protein [Paenibacillus alginolyticus]MCY9694350.1 hypothetical protein [Paenibacillus alginolyticus]
MPGWEVQTSFLNFSADYLQAFGFRMFYLILSAAPNSFGNIVSAVGIGADFPFAGADASHTLALNALLPANPHADYLLEADLSGVSLHDLSSLTQFAKGAAFDKVLPSSVPINELKLLALRISVNPYTRVINAASIDVKIADNWTIITDNFVFESIVASFTVVLPTVSPQVSASLIAIMTVPGNIQVGTGFSIPDLQMEAQLLSTIPLSSLVNIYLPGVDIPTINIDSCQFNLNFSTLYWDLQITSSENWPLAGSIELKNLMLMAEGQNTGIPTGSAYASFDTAGTTILLGAVYLGSGKGWLFLGESREGVPLDIGLLMTEIGNRFGVQVPRVLSSLTLSVISLQVNTGSDAFGFTCAGSFELAGIGVQFSTIISLVYDSDKKLFDKDFIGTLTLTSPNGRSIDFKVTYNSDASSSQFDAQWQSDGEPLGFADICGAFGFTPPDLPHDLDLNLKSAGFTYDTLKGELVITTASATYGQAVFVVTKQEGKNEYIFLLDVNKDISLSNLPLVGGMLSPDQTLSVSNLQVVVSSSPISPATASSVNQLIKEASSEYPNLAAIGTASNICLSAAIHFGSETIPLTLGIEGSQSTAGNTVTGQGTSVPTTHASQTDGTTWFNIQKSFGPVTFEKVGVQYQDSTLWFRLSAALSAGGLTIDLQGLSIGSPLKTFHPEFNLQGLGIDFEKSPIAIGGSLIHAIPKAPITLEFDGEAILGTPAFSVHAYGSYADLDGQPSLFIFAQVNGEFGGPPAFFVTGIAAGFGYNSKLRIPGQNEIYNFPLVAGVTNPSVLGGTSATPLQALSALTGGNAPWVSHTLGETWLAAGVTFTSFELVNSQALMLVEFGQELTIALIGLSTARFPQAGSEIYAQVQLELEVLLQPSMGVFAATAMLSPNSFVIDPACLLTGGFAFYSWFSNNSHAGDFVLTLGGYNHAFSPPAWYPTEPRLGFTWSMDSKVSISGSAYFALTPAAIMAGGALDVNFHDGNLKAWLTAYADVIIWWNPFYLYAEIGISVGASYKLDLWFTSKTFSVELGADLVLWGPPTGGTATIHWWIISFTIDFGATNQLDNPLPQQWSEFQKILPKNPIQITPTSGLSGKEQLGDNKLWVVRSDQFAFTTRSAVPAHQIFIGSTSTTPIAQGDPLNIFPMQATNLTSTHRVSLKGKVEIDLSKWKVIPEKMGVPKALWGTDSGILPANDEQQLVPDQIIGLNLTAPLPALGSSPGTIELTTISTDPLPKIGITPLAIGVSSQGDVPQSGLNTIATISSEIMSETTKKNRDQLYSALQTLGYAPDSNGSLTALSTHAGVMFTGEPMMVPRQGG